MQRDVRNECAHSNDQRCIKHSISRQGNEQHCQRWGYRCQSWRPVQMEKYAFNDENVYSVYNSAGRPLGRHGSRYLDSWLLRSGYFSINFTFHGVQYFNSLYVCNIVFMEKGWQAYSIQAPGTNFTVAFLRNMMSKYSQVAWMNQKWMKTNTDFCDFFSQTNMAHVFITDMLPNTFIASFKYSFCTLLIINMFVNL